MALTTTAAAAAAVVGICVLDAARIASPPRSNVRFHDGVLHVFAVARGDLFDRAGVRAGDRVEALEGVELHGVLSFADRYRTVRPGDEVRLRVRRDDEVLLLAAVASANLTPGRLAVALLPVAVLLALGVGVAAVRPRQAVLNLMLNARDAMERGGEIRVRLVRWRDGVEIEVADEGPGMTAEALERGFEPFFTTKRLGTGLGLANVRRFAGEHGGEVAARNLSPRGAAVTLRLPGSSPSVGGGADGTG